MNKRDATNILEANERTSLNVKLVSEAYSTLAEVNEDDPDYPKNENVIKRLREIKEAMFYEYY